MAIQSTGMCSAHKMMEQRVFQRCRWKETWGWKGGKGGGMIVRLTSTGNTGHRHCRTLSPDLEAAPETRLLYRAAPSAQNVLVFARFMLPATAAAAAGAGLVEVGGCTDGGGATVGGVTLVASTTTPMGAATTAEDGKADLSLTRATCGLVG